MSQNLVYSTRTWLTEPLAITDDTIYVDSINNITNTTVQLVTAPVAVSGVMRIGLATDKNSIVSIVVYNITTNTVISSSNYTIVIENTVPVLKITTGSWIATGNSLTITTLDGNLIYVNGEQIKYSSVNTTDNTLSGLFRGQNGTSAQNLIPKYTEVWGSLSQNKMNNIGYVQNWNSYDYNTVIGDPLQISSTPEALFLTNRTYIAPFPIISPYSLTTTTTTTIGPPPIFTTTSTTTIGPPTTTSTTTIGSPTTTTTTSAPPPPPITLPVSPSSVDASTFQVGVPITPITFTVSGGTGIYTWSVNGFPDPGLSYSPLSGPTCTLSGTPTGTGVTGLVVNVILQATDTGTGTGTATIIGTMQPA